MRRVDLIFSSHHHLMYANCSIGDSTILAQLTLEAPQYRQAQFLLEYGCPLGHLADAVSVPASLRSSA
jgi:hypothetical protein